MGKTRTPLEAAQTRLGRALAAFRKANEALDAAAGELLRLQMLALVERYPAVTAIKWVVEWEYDHGDYFLTTHGEAVVDSRTPKTRRRPRTLDLNPDPDTLRLIGRTVDDSVPDHGDFQFTVSVEQLRELSW